jgi:molybdopterin molybdotransferase
MAVGSSPGNGKNTPVADRARVPAPTTGSGRAAGGPGRAVPGCGADDVAWASARTTAYAVAEPLPARTVPLVEAGGGTLAEPLRALTPLPAFDNSAMDGYAVGSEQGPWRLVGRVLAGEIYPDPIAPDEAVEIGTGAGVPRGAVAVLTYERAVHTGDKVDGSVPPGLNIRRMGEGAPAAADLMPAGAPVTPTLLGLAAMVGLDELVIRPRPTVAAVLTGDEIIHSGLSGAGMVRDGVGLQLPGLVRWLGGDLRSTEFVPDGPADVLGNALAASTADVLVTCGSAARGPADRLRDTLREMGARVLVPSVSCRPGHPQQLARLSDGRWLIGLPGNPYAALVAALTLLGPLLAGLGGRRLPTLPLATLQAPKSIASEQVTRILPARKAAAGAVELLGRDRPANLWGAVQADSLAVIRPGWKGEPTPQLLLPDA